MEKFLKCQISQKPNFSMEKFLNVQISRWTNFSTAKFLKTLICLSYTQIEKDQIKVWQNLKLKKLILSKYETEKF